MTSDTGVSLLSDELVLRKQIQDYYLPSQLVEAILSSGGDINSLSTQSNVAIGFLDISHYTFLSQLLSPSENQTVLNGLYSTFNWVLRKRGGYLNKIEGDSMMFHYGGPIDPKTKDMDDDEALKIITTQLFYSCVELQRVCALFNQVNEQHLEGINDESTVKNIKAAYKILINLREGFASASFNALFQIRIRVGAAVGSVLIGNFGPDGAKQWDVIGMPVIEAKRMESCAPIGGFRITSGLFKILDKYNVTKQYHRRICREAEMMGGVYKNISFNELFKFSKVRLKDKFDAQFETYSVQVNPSLPESIMQQAKLHLRRGEKGADAIVEFIKYYRGNHFVINQLEILFNSAKILIRKDFLYEIMFGFNKNGHDKNAHTDSFKDKKLYDILVLLGRLQDNVKAEGNNSNGDEESLFERYELWLGMRKNLLKENYDSKRIYTQKAYYFHNMVFPLFFDNIKAAILEYQKGFDEVEELESS